MLLFQIQKKFNLSKEYEGALISESYKLEDIVDEEFFWEEIENSFSNNYQKQIENLHSLLSQRTKEEIIKFKNTFDLIMIHSYDSNLWEKAYAINMGCSDDTFEYFRSWIISQGKNKFYNSLSNPDYLKYFAKKEIMQNYEGFEYVAQEVADIKGFSLTKNSSLPKYELKGNANIESGFIKNIPMSILTWFN